MDEITFTATELGAMDVGQLRAARQRIAARLHDLLYDEHGETRDLSGRDNAAEREEFDRLTHLDNRAQAHLAIRESFNRGGTETAFGGHLVDRSDPGVAPGEVLRMDVERVRDVALRALESRGRHLDGRNQDRVDSLLRARLSEDSPNLDGSLIARRLLLTENPTYRSAWQRVLTESHPVLTNAEAEALRAVKDLDRYENRAMADFTNTAGGYGIPVFIDPSILLSAQGSIAPIRDLARTETANTIAWKGVSAAGVSWTFQTEGSVVTDNSPTLAQPVVNVHMARGFIPYSFEVEQDYPNFAAEMAQLLAAGYDELLADKLMRGSGTGEPFGILVALSGTASSVTTTTAGTLGSADVDKVWEALPDRWKPRSNWIASYGTLDQVAALSTLNAGAIAYQTVDLTGVVQTIRTRPAQPTSYGFASRLVAGTSVQHIAIVGDFSNYLIAQRAGMALERVEHLFQQQTAGTGVGYPTGQRGFLAWGRVGGDSIIDDGFRLLTNKTS